MTRNIILFIGLIFSVLQATAQEEGLSIGKKSIDASAILEVTAPSNDKGVLLPRLTSFQRESIAVPAEGLLVFDTDQDEFYYFDGNQWLSLGHIKYRKGSNAIDEEHLTINVGNAKNVGITNKLAVGDEDFVHETVAENSVAIQGDVDADGEISAKNNISTEGKFVGYGTVPLGGIIMWSGSTPPDGWALCNGQYAGAFKTPDLRGRFVVGHDPDAIEYDQPGDLSSYGETNGEKGGMESVELTVDQMPGHSHEFKHYHRYSDTRRRAHEIDVVINDSFAGGTKETIFVMERVWSAGDNNYYAALETLNNSTNYNSSAIEMEPAGENQPHENRPPFYTLAFIMRVK